MKTISASAAACRGQRVEQRRRHRPAVEIDAGQAGRGGVEAGVDVVRSRFRAACAHASPGQRAQYADRDRGLARARARRADDDRAGAHRAPRSLSRNATMPPMTIRAGETTFSRAAALDQRAERRDDGAFVRQGRVLDERRRRVVGQSAGAQISDGRGHMGQAHIDDDRLAGAGECAPVRTVVACRRQSRWPG